MWIWTANKYAKFHAKNLIEVKILQKVFWGYFFWNTLYIFSQEIEIQRTENFQAPGELIF